MISINFIRTKLKRLHSISFQLFIIFIIGMIVPVLLGGFLSYYKSAQLIEEQVSKVATETITQVRDKIDLLYNKLDDKSMMILYNYDIHHILERDLGQNEYEKLEANKNAMRFINSITVNSPEILDIYVFDSLRQNSIYSSDNSTLINQWETDWYKTIMHADGGVVWFGLSHDSYLKGMNIGAPVYALGRTIKSFKNGKVIGVVFIEVRGSELMEELKSVKFGETGYINVIDESNRYIYHPNKELYGKLSTFNGNNYLSNERNKGILTIPKKLKNGWTVMGVVPINELTTDSKVIRNFTLWIALCSVLLALAMGYFVTRKIGQPLVKLSRLMKRGEAGDLTVRSEVSGRNEISHLSNSFNNMIQQIEILIGQIGEKESQKKIAEIRALRYQINPHFLYNTLNSIRWMAKLGRTEEVANAVTTLVHLLEASLERNGTFVKLGQELELLEKYMVIQQYRYDFDIKLTIHCPTELKEVEIPRMLLQPLLENAIFHGIAPKDEDGNIEIDIFQKGSDIIIDIIDDGIGIEEDRIHHLLTIESDTKPKGMTSIGLRHVHQTLQWFYGKDYGVEMDSIVSVGTKVRITFSKKKGVEYVQGSVS